MLVGGATYVVNAFRTSAAIHQEMTDNGIAHQSELSRTRRSGERYGRAIEIGSGEATTLALIAIVACWAAAVGHRQVSDAVGHNSPAKLSFDHLLG
jgi:hypothetical protein